MDVNGHDVEFPPFPWQMAERFESMLKTRGQKTWGSTAEGLPEGYSADSNYFWRNLYLWYPTFEPHS